MITVYQKGELHFQNKIYKCALGRNGIKKKKKEGDGCTPEGIYSLGPLYYRSDRIKNLKKLFPKYNIGLSDHTDDILTSLSTIPIGVKIIEKHFIYNKRIKSLDSKFSIDPKKLKELKLKSTKVFDSLWNGKFELQAPEKKSISYKRSIFSIRKIEKNENWKQEFELD